MKDIAYYNGKIGRIDEVQAPITDRGLYFGDGVYDAAMVRNRKIFALDDHLDRFYNSLRLLRIEPPMERSELAATLNDLVSRLDSDAPHMLYWQSTRAAAHRKHAFPAGAKATLMAFAEACPLDRHDHPYKLITVEDTRFLHCNIKTLNLIPNCMAMQRAVEAGCDEVVFHRGDRVTEGAHSSLAIIRDGVFCTPPADELILPSITRKHFLDLCDKLGAGLACSRPLTEGVNWLPTERYVGVSGLMLTPKAYIAVGISGQMQHMVGCNRSGAIFAINKDKNAPIFKQCDFGLVGDIKDVLPAITAAL